jgi:hypothetical protein
VTVGTPPCRMLEDFRPDRPDEGQPRRKRLYWQVWNFRLERRDATSTAQRAAAAGQVVAAGSRCNCQASLRSRRLTSRKVIVTASQRQIEDRQEGWSSGLNRGPSPWLEVGWRVRMHLCAL